MIAVFLQARVDSTRLPGKALLTLGGKPMVQIVMERLRKISADLYVLVTDRNGKQSFTPFAEKVGFTVYEGSKEDVLGRFCRAIETFKPKTVIRATGDNPLVSWELAQRILSEHLLLSSDYSAFQGMPLGLGVEVVEASILLKAEKETEDPYDHEHVTPYVYRNPDKFYLHRPLVEPEYRGRFRVTVDTETDFRKVEWIYQQLESVELPSLEDLIPLLRGIEGS
ncbi:MAG: NTP transferase domain-containing protein [Spirochaetes bacterium]|nr:NTP transferase domain-containing protein [Spirochaetota bacterium]